MSSLKGLYGRKDDSTTQSNFGVDYVIHYLVPRKERAAAEAGFVQLVEALASVGLATEVRRGSGDSLLIFIKIASLDLLQQQVYRSRLQDWLQGVRTTGPERDASNSLRDEPITDAERLRLVYLMITRPPNEGGAGISEASAKWKHVAAIFPLHDHAFNKAWIRQWSKKYLLEDADVDDIRRRFGEGVAIYFAFLRSYFRFLVAPAALGFGFWMFMGQFSYVYALASCFWSVIFFEYWRMKEIDLAVQWGVRGVSNIQQPRAEFKWDYETEDAVTGEPVKVYPPTKRLQTQLLQVPFAFACIIVLGSLVVTCNSLEVFINQVYQGPGKTYLAFLPTIILCTLTPTFSTVLMSAASKLTERENYDTMDAYEAALVQKQFVLNFMTSYMALLFTAFVYIPFGDRLLPLLEFWKRTAQTISFSEKPLPSQTFEVDPTRISKQMFYFTVTAQIVNFATEVVVPYVKQKAFAKAKAFQSKGVGHEKDHAEEAEFLQRVRSECTLDVYDVTSDYREMVMQFGYLSMFSVAWPLTACCFLVNNWVELRSDALKIAISCRRPIPWRGDSIGPWLSAIGFLSWLGSITSAAIVYLCSGSQEGTRKSTSQMSAWGGLLTILLAENFYLAVQWAVRFAMSKLESQGLLKERRERYQMKKKLLQDNLGESATVKATSPGLAMGEKITREALEEEARQVSIRGQGSPEQAFWQRQRGVQETVQVGRQMIEEQGAADTKAKAKATSKTSPIP